MDIKFTRNMFVGSIHKFTRERVVSEDQIFSQIKTFTYMIVLCLWHPIQPFNSEISFIMIAKVSWQKVQN